MSERPNVLFIMLDQLRADSLGAAGNPLVRTPNIDWLCRRGVRFENAFVQSAICGPSRMCFYTGRHVHAHRSTWNAVPLPGDEVGIGEYFTRAGYRAVSVGKTHYVPDGRFVPAGLTSEELPEIRRAVVQSADSSSPAPLELGMEVLAGPEWDVGYEHFLAERGYRVEEEEHARIHQGWYLPLVNDYAMTVQVPDGRFLSAWDYGAARFPLRVAKNDAPPAYLTDIALRFLRETADVPWMMHLSYIYPHCPVAAPAPYHAMYELDQIPPPIRGEEDFAHPVLQEMRNEHRSRPFGKDEVWRLIRAAYYGMVTCVDEQLGRVIAALNETGQLDRTVIVLTSDHGDYLGDHYLSEKEFFFDQAIRVPLIVSHPDTACRRMDGAVRDEFVQSVDVLPTLLDCAEIPHDDRIQGRSFLPLLSDPAKRSWQEAVFGDWDFEFNAFAARLGLRPERCRAWMVRDRHYKYIHFLDLPDMLFDLCNDPDELHNIADTTAGRAAVDRYRLKLLDWRMETEDRSRSGWYLRRWGARGVPLPADSFADYEFDAPHDHKDSDGAGGEEE